MARVLAITKGEFHVWIGLGSSLGIRYGWVTAGVWAWARIKAKGFN